eukprot:COSAG02_NODE_331_length_24480_cov_22.114720_24_plen_88_part_00
MSSEEFGAQLAKSGIGIKPAYCFTDVVTDDIDYFRVVSVISNRFSLNIGSDVYLVCAEAKYMKPCMVDCDCSCCCCRATARVCYQRR